MKKPINLKAKFRKVWTDPVGSKLISSSIAALGTVVLAFLLNTQTVILEYVLYVLCLNVPLWILLASVLLLVLVMVYTQRFRLRGASAFDILPSFSRLLERIDQKYFHEKVEYRIVFQELDGDSLWLKLEFKQTSVNKSKNEIKSPLEFPLEDRRTKDPDGSINGVGYNFEHDNFNNDFRPYRMEVTIAPDEKVEISFSVLVEYNANDSELFQTYRYCEDFSFSYEDKISNHLHKDCFDFRSQRMHDYIGVNGQIEYNKTNKFKGEVQLNKGLLPYQGIYFKWRKI